VQLTPPGRGAVATLLVDGPDALSVAESLLRTKSTKNLAKYPVDRPIFAHFGGENGEEVIVRLRQACHGHLASGTPKNSLSLELHCHGGFAVVQTIEKAFIDRGFLAVAWKQWAAQMETDPFAAAALASLADACTERTAAILLDQYRGALRTAFDEIKNAAQVDALLQRAALGLHLTKLWRVVLAGAPNVGKSSLLNALAGYPRAIVHHTPGTTRDLVTVRTAFEGWPVELCDTAGLGADDRLTDPIEQAGIELAQRRLAQADLAVLVFDSSRPWTVADQFLLEQHPQAIVIHNKADLPRAPGHCPDGTILSAATGEGVEQLPRRIAERLVPNPPPPGVAVPFTEDQVTRLRSLAQNLSRD
jgi:tRNA modification GTPase